MRIGIGWAACGDEQASKAYTWRYPPSSPGCVLRRRLRLGNARKDSKAAAAGASRLLRRWEFPWIKKQLFKGRWVHLHYSSLWSICGSQKSQKYGWMMMNVWMASSFSISSSPFRKLRMLRDLKPETCLQLKSQVQWDRRIDPSWWTSLNWW